MDAVEARWKIEPIRIRNDITDITHINLRNQIYVTLQLDQFKFHDLCFSFVLADNGPAQIQNKQIEIHE